MTSVERGGVTVIAAAAAVVVTRRCHLLRFRKGSGCNANSALLHPPARNRAFHCASPLTHLALRSLAECIACIDLKVGKSEVVAVARQKMADKKRKKKEEDKKKMEVARSTRDDYASIPDYSFER
ncbi:hypothetical protein HZH66_004240 [Vespula vulgaris]|uniref:Uncharacterized protein n=1 Tax=Vespula vulgaris TaxID=7454 RepID=A0A834NEN9_VESVU|nr:hypothetical protein HZH66_004240 [Vespula vulgaris]